MRVVEHERDVREYADADAPPRRRRRRKASSCQRPKRVSSGMLQAQPKTGSGGPQASLRTRGAGHFDSCSSIGSAARESSDGQEQSEKNNGKKEPEIGGVHRAGGERGEARQKREADKPIVHGRRQQTPPANRSPTEARRDLTTPTPATTWLAVSADMARPTETSAPASRTSPK